MYYGGTTLSYHVQPRQMPFKDVKTGQGTATSLTQNNKPYDVNTASENKWYGGSMVCLPRWCSGRARDVKPVGGNDENSASEWTEKLRF